MSSFALSEVTVVEGWVVTVIAGGVVVEVLEVLAVASDVVVVPNIAAPRRPVRLLTANMTKMSTIIPKTASILVMLCVFKANLLSLVSIRVLNTVV